MDIPSADLARIRELYTQGRYRQAHDAAGAFGPYRSWTGTAARLIGGRLAIQLGGPNLGRRLHVLADRLEDALESTRRSLKLQPWFRPGVQSSAHVLVRLGHSREALDLLTEAA